MRTISINEQLFHGAVSVQRTAEGFKPWRIPYDEFELFPPNGLNGTAERATGIRLSFCSNTCNVFAS